MSARRQVSSGGPERAGTAVPAAPPGAGGGSHKVLDRRRVLDAAVVLIDCRGLRGLTMRGLGAYLGVNPMALYRYAPSREKLLDGVVKTVVDELYGDPEVYLVAHGDDWRDYLRRLAHGVRRRALAHPEVFPLIATRPPAAPWVRPPLRSLRWVESFLDTLVGHGFPDAAAVGAYRAFSSFLLGHLLLEVSALGVDTGPVEEASPQTAGVAVENLSAYPHLQRLQGALSEDHAAAEFEASLENLLDRLSAMVTP